MSLMICERGDEFPTFDERYIRTNSRVNEHCAPDVKIPWVRFIRVKHGRRKVRDVLLQDVTG